MNARERTIAELVKGARQKVNEFEQSGQDTGPIDDALDALTHQLAIERDGREMEQMMLRNVPAALRAAKVEALREAADAIDGRFSHVKDGEIPFHPGEELDGHMMQPHVRGMIQRWLRARADESEGAE